MAAASALIASLLGSAPTPAIGGSPPNPVDRAASGSLHIDRGDRASVTRAFTQVYLPARRAVTEWVDGDVRGCRAGELSPQSRQSQLSLVNYYREHAGGLRPVFTLPEFDDAAQEAALMMDANDRLSHAPSADWACYRSAGADAASKSNLATAAGAAAIIHYMWDYGDENTNVGHRRWLLHPTLRRVGIGSTTGSHALFVNDADHYWDRRPGNLTWVSWPAAGFVPQELVYPRWSFSYAGDGVADIGQARIRATLNGSPIDVEVVNRYNGSTLGPTLVFEPKMSGRSLNPYRTGADAPDRLVAITIDDLIIDGHRRSKTYRVRIIDTRCLGRQPTIVGTGGDDRLVGTPGDDVIVGLGGDDLIAGGGGNDLICAGRGNDVVAAGAGIDGVRAGGGDDLVAGGPGIDLLAGNTGNDQLRGGEGADLISAGPGNDQVTQ